MYIYTHTHRQPLLGNSAGSWMCNSFLWSGSSWLDYPWNVLCYCSHQLQCVCHCLQDFYLISLVSQNSFPIPKTFTSGNCLPRSSSLFSLHKKHVLCQPHPSPCLYVSLVHSHQQVWWLFQAVLNDSMGQKKSKPLKMCALGEGICLGFLGLQHTSDFSKPWKY